jgi:GNAT superfamily N-acetyltransferase
MELTVHRVRPEHTALTWGPFAPHHYMSADLSPQARCWLVLHDDEPVAFTSVLALPGKVPNCWREHRTVVLPDWQGMGLGPAVGDMLGDMHLSDGKRLYSRTAHPRLAAYRRASPLWRETATSGQRSRLEMARFSHQFDRPASSFEYVGISRAG